MFCFSAISYLWSWENIYCIFYNIYIYIYNTQWKAKLNSRNKTYKKKFWYILRHLHNMSIKKIYYKTERSTNKKKCFIGRKRENVLVFVRKRVSSRLKRQNKYWLLTFCRKIHITNIIVIISYYCFLPTKCCWCVYKIQFI